MKKLFIILSFSLLSFATIAQDKPLKPINKDQSTKDTVIKDKTYKLYTGSKGGKYILVISKTGKEYKRYFKATTKN